MARLSSVNILTILFYLFISTNEGNQECVTPNVTTPHPIVQAAIGYTVILNCSYNTPVGCKEFNQDVVWYNSANDAILSRRNDEPPTNQDPVNYGNFSFAGVNDLQITNVRNGDADTYKCRVLIPTVGNGHVDIQLTVSEPASPDGTKIEIDPEIVWEGDDVTMSCSAEGLPVPEYTWSDCENQNQISAYSVLHLEEVSRQDISCYRCTSFNDEGHDSDDIILEVFYEPNADWPTCKQEDKQSEENLMAGDILTIICEAIDGNPYPVLTWFNDSLPLPSDGYSTPAPGDMKTINRFTWTLEPNDDGRQYVCKGSQRDDVIKSCMTAHLDVKYPPETPTCTNNDQYYEENVAQIKCESQGGNPLASLKWYNDSQELTPTSPVHSSNAVIAVYQWLITRVDNQAIFRCDASNIASTIPKSCYSNKIDVYFPPVSLLLTGYIGAVKMGEQVQLSCQSESSNPASTINWYKNNQSIQNDDFEQVQPTTSDGGAFYGNITSGGLHIHTRASHNANTFSCTTSRIGIRDEVKSQYQKITVYFPPSEPEECKTNLTGYNAPVLAGNELTLTCTSCSGHPKPMLEWFTGDNKIYTGLSEVSESPGVYDGVICTQNLILHLKRNDHQQRYRCECHNEEFTAEDHKSVSDEIMLDVHYSPYVDHTEENQREAVNLTDNVDLVCEIDSNPEVEITWFDNNNGTITNGTGRFFIFRSTADTITTGILKIMNVTESDFGYYKCLAGNYINDTSFTIQLSVTRRPYPAYNVLVTIKTEENLTLRWTPDFDGGFPQQFQLEYRNNRNTERDFKRTDPTPGTTDTIQGLMAMTEYHITVVSFNSIGESHSDPPTVYSTLPETPKSKNIAVTRDGVFIISVPTRACVKVEIFDGTHWIKYSIADPCYDEVKIKLPGSGELQICFCTDSMYTECGAPLRYAYDTVQNTSPAITVPILISLIIASSIAVVILAILVWRKASENKLASKHGMRYAPDDEYYETTNVDSGFLQRQPNQRNIDFSSMVNTAMSPRIDEDNTNSDKDNSTRYAICSTVGKHKQDMQTADTNAVVDESHEMTSVTDQTNDAQYAKVDIKKKKKKSGQRIDVYSKVNKIKDKKTTKKGQLNEDKEGKMTADAIDSTSPSMKGIETSSGEFAYANVLAVKGKTIPSATGSPLDNSAYEDVAIKKNTDGTKTGTKTMTDNGGNGAYDGVYGKDYMSSNVASQKSDAGDNPKDKNVEGLVYADLDLKSTSKPKRAPKKLPAETVDYAAINFPIKK